MLVYNRDQYYGSLFFINDLVNIFNNMAIYISVQSNDELTNFIKNMYNKFSQVV